MKLLEILKAIFLGIVEGITEWLPVSSTGHMILFDEFVKLNVSDEFKEMFFVVIQLGAILAVPTLFWNKLWPFTKTKSKEEKKGIIDLWLKVIVGVLPAAVIGLLLDDFFDEHFYRFEVVAVALVVYGIAFIIIELTYICRLISQVIIRPTKITLIIPIRNIAFSYVFNKFRHSRVRCHSYGH